MKDYKYFLEQCQEYGYIEEIKYPLIVVNGLPNARIDEILIFEDGQLGQVFSLLENSVEVLLFSKENIKSSSSVTRTNLFVSIPLGKYLIGKTITAFSAEDILGISKNNEIEETRNVENEALDIVSRVKIEEPFLTGTTIVDMMIPLGKGQRELVIGDRKIGKTAFLLTVMLNLAKEDTLIIYAAIGKRQNEIKKLEEFLIQNKLKDKVVLVTSTANDPAGLIFLTPYSAMTIAEFFRDKGQNTVVILDDLTVHAKVYREISLVANRFPGRDAYPGDIFYLHSRLLERAGAFTHGEKGKVYITCLPVVETVEGDLRGYIPTNIMSMTDGHIFFDSNEFFEGRRPAINIPLSVTRVGRQTQSKLKKEMNRTLLSFLSNYTKMLTFAHFGSELTPELVETLNKGKNIMSLFNQHYTMVLPEAVQLILIAMVWNNYPEIDNEEKLNDMKVVLIKAFEKDNVSFNQVVNCETFDKLLENVNLNKEKILNYAKPS